MIEGSKKFNVFNLLRTSTYFFWSHFIHYRGLAGMLVCYQRLSIDLNFNYAPRGTRTSTSTEEGGKANQLCYLGFFENIYLVECKKLLDLEANISRTKLGSWEKSGHLATKIEAGLTFGFTTKLKFVYKSLSLIHSSTLFAFNINVQKYHLLLRKIGF